MQDGPWTTPATWDCNCIPSDTVAVVINHDVTFSEDLALIQPSVTIGSAGILRSTAPSDLESLTNLFVSGILEVSGWVTVFDTLQVAGLMVLGAHLDLAGRMLMDDGHVEIGGSLFVFNIGAISGSGSICVTSGTNNAGSITGNVDICDVNSVATEPPYIGYNTGIVANSVTFCAAGPCAVGITEESGADFAITTLTANRLLFTSPYPSAFEWTIFDISGRPVLQGLLNGSAEADTDLDISGLAVGLHVLQIRKRDAERPVSARFLKM